MSVLAEAISVIVPIDVLEEKYPGGFDAYWDAQHNDQFCADDDLARSGFMHPGDVGHWVGLLEAHGLEPIIGESADSRGTWKDCAVVDQFHGPTRACPWLQFEKSEEGYSYCWLTGTEPGELVAPPRWEPASSRSMVLNRRGPGGSLIMERTGDALDNFARGRRFHGVRLWPERNSTPSDARPHD